MQSHQRYFPLGGNRFAFVANGGDPGRRPRRQRAGAREPPRRTRASRSSATSKRRDRRPRRAARRRSRSSPGAGTFADKTERLVELVERLGGGEASLEAARLAKADQAAELVREFPDLEGTSAPSTRGSPATRRRSARRSRSSTCPTPPDAPLPETEAGKVLAAADKIDTLTVSFALGHKPTGSRDPYGLRRAAIGLCRLATEGGLDDRRASCFRTRSATSSRSGSRACSTCRSSSCAPPGARRSRDLGGSPRLAQALAALPDERLEPIHTAYTARRAGSPAGARARRRARPGAARRAGRAASSRRRSSGVDREIAAARRGAATSSGARGRAPSSAPPSTASSRTCS